ncbi:exo-alpha-sialidase [Streptomyces albidochromogenes]|uniref:Exo-alpha-sialidase n=1 Tax=Streptomyces albidochromogenes TaxID=329524 RepID=A0ABW6FLB2_9ACTN
MSKRFTSAGALAGALLVASAVWSAGCGAPERDPGRRDAPRATRPARPAPVVPSGRELPGTAHLVGFAADGSGFALLATCAQDAQRPENGFCRQYVAVLDKGASRWELRPSPLRDPSGTDGVSADMRVLGSGRAWLHEGMEDDRHRSWFTADGGRSWQARDVRRAGSVRSIPPGAALSTLCGYPAAPDGHRCARDRLLVLSPDDGRLRALRTRPPLTGRLEPAPYAEPDGSWWVSGRDPASGGPAVAVSRDAGRTWTASRLDRPFGKPGGGVRVSVGDGVVYAAETGELPSGEPVKNPLRAVHRSRDGGRTWERTWTTRARGEPRSLLGVLIPGAGDALGLYTERGHCTSADGGRSFTRTAGPAFGFASTAAPGRLVSEGGCGFSVSADGVRWTSFTVGGCED